MLRVERVDMRNRLSCEMIADAGVLRRRRRPR